MCSELVEMLKNHRLKWQQIWLARHQIKFSQSFDSEYRQTSNIRRILVGNKIVDHLDIVEASSVGAAPTTSSFSTWHLALIYCTKTNAWQNKENLIFWVLCGLY